MPSKTLAQNGIKYALLALPLNLLCKHGTMLN